MTRFDVPEMSCGHCTAAIRKAVTTLDPSASVDCDLGGSSPVESTLGDEALSAAVKEANTDATTVIAA